MAQHPIRISETTWLTLNGPCNQCGACVGEGTRILLRDGRWKPIERICIGEKILGFDEEVRRGQRFRKIRGGSVLAVSSRETKAYEIITSIGSVVATSDHRWLWSQPPRGAGEWRSVERLRPGHRIRELGVPASNCVGEHSRSFRFGYLAGVSEGDGSLGTSFSCGKDRQWYSLRVRQSDHRLIDRSERFFRLEGIKLNRRNKFRNNKEGALLCGIEAWDVGRVAEIRQVLGSPTERRPEFVRGFVSGFFDAEGSCDGNVLRMTNTNFVLLDRVCSYLELDGFAVVKEPIRERSPHRFNGRVIRSTRPVRDIRLLGGKAEQIRFFSVFNPALTRKLCVDGHVVGGAYADVEKVRPCGQAKVYDLTTTTHTFIAEGLFSHNCCRMVDAGKLYTCENLVIVSRVGEPQATYCRVYADRVADMPITMYSPDGAQIERVCALGSQEESLAILDRGIGAGCSMTVGIRRHWPE